MHADIRKQPIVPLTGWERFFTDATAMFFYLSVVYVWGLTIFPLGRDYRLLAHPRAGAPFLTGRLLTWEVDTFGTFAVGYHLVNLLLLYACMLCLYWFVRRAIKGPPWLGALAAALFMANPIHSEAVLNLSGAVDLLPCFLALAALTAYAEDVAAPRRWWKVIIPVLFAFAVLPFQENAFLLAVMILYEMIAPGEAGQRVQRLAPLGLITLAAWHMHSHIFDLSSLNPARMLAPLYFIFFPLGCLPETARTFCARPWLGWVAGAAVVLLLALIYRTARRPVILFGLLAMVAVRLFQGHEFIDPVHLIGGGKLLLANALFNVALVALFYRMMDHPKWRKPVIVFTTMLCVVFFGLEIRSVFAWRYAGDVLRQYWADCNTGKEREDTRIDYQYYLGAPICLSESLKYDTPFSEGGRDCGGFFLPMHYSRNPRLQLAYEVVPPDQGRLVIRGKRPVDLLCYPYTLAQPGGKLSTDGGRLETLVVEEDALVLSVNPGIWKR